MVILENKDPQIRRREFCLSTALEGQHFHHPFINSSIHAFIHACMHVDTFTEVR